ncbi:MAG: imidazole glycerol phosphate synthase subunit HisF [Planctomycetes bacterium]|nr:imidazole glycerol phosphate synthase subunit HisF [Planctomycetota bacterium]
MLRTRIIPCLLLKEGGLVKTVRFAQPAYVGDPLNVVKIFNTKEVDELFLLDIACRTPDLPLLRSIAGEAFMPLAYGGGLRTTEDVRAVLASGFEKVVLKPGDLTLLRTSAELVGSQSIVAAIDVQAGKVRSLGVDPADCARDAQAAGAGEILLNSMDRDGTMTGFDLALIRRVAEAVGVPLIALGGAASTNDLAEAIKAGAAAAAAGSLFVYHGKHRAVLISYPERP